MFELYSKEWNHLKLTWEQYITSIIETELEGLNDNWVHLSIKDRDNEPYISECWQDLMFGDYDFFNRIFNTEVFFNDEEEILEMMKSPRDMMYVFQYVKIKDPDEEIDPTNMEYLMNLFIYRFARELLEDDMCDNDPTQMLAVFIHKYAVMAFERKILCGMICRRQSGFDGNINKTILSYLYSDIQCCDWRLYYAE